jgi:hypothetical protein
LHTIGGFVFSQLVDTSYQQESIQLLSFIVPTYVRTYSI